MSDAEQDPPKGNADPPKDPPKDPTGIATTQPSLISPLQDPAAVAARLAKKKLGSTMMGVAPPAAGNKTPVSAGEAAGRPTPMSVRGGGTGPLGGSRPPPGLPSGGKSVPPPPVTTKSVPPPSAKPPSLGKTPSVPPAVAPASVKPQSVGRTPSVPPISVKPQSVGRTPSVPPASVKPPIAPSIPKIPVAPRAPDFDDSPPASKPPRPLSVPPSPHADTVLAMEAVKAEDLKPKTSDTVKSPAAPEPKTAPSAAPGGSTPPGKPEAKFSSTLIGTAPPAPLFGPSKIVPRRRTPAGGMPAVAAVPSKEESPKITPAAGAPPPVPPPPAHVTGSVVPAKPSMAPPIIRIPGAGAVAQRQDGTLICEILVRNGSVSQEKVDEAIALQEERGGQIGRILVQLGACTEDAIARALIEQLKIRKDGGSVLLSDISHAAREKKDVVGLKVLTRPGRTVAVLLLTDLFSLLVAALLASSVHLFRVYSEEGIDFTSWLVVGPSIALCMLTFLGLELYSPMAKSTPDEIRDITFATSLVHLGASVLSTLGDLPIVKWGILVRTVWWMATLFLVPVVRALVRNYFSTSPWWGIPVCVLGAAKTGRLVVRTLRAQPRSGLKPVMMLDDDKSKFGTLRASFTNEVMDVYSVNVQSAHFLTEEQRAAFTNDIFGDAAPISSDHIPAAAPIMDPPLEVTNDPASASMRAAMPAPPKAPSERPRPSREFFNPESTRQSKASLTQDASQFPRGKFAEVDGVPLVGDLSLAPILAQRLKIPYAVVAMPGVDSPKLLQIIERVGGHFTHLLIIPDLFGFASMGVPAKSLGGILGLEIRQQLLLPGPRLAKRVMDTALTLAGSLFVAPFLLLIALLIKLDSKGPVFYWQNRLGKDGTYFKAYKFRTMHGDGEARLKAILESDPALKAEYDIYHKLRKDPRVTRIGRILRKFSLDEFPQLLNVINGDMSLVGPRPYIERELTEMNGQEKIILRAPPGMTGMWQVSDRNATSFAQRVQIDVYYVRNWSPWLDIHILAKTFGVVIKGSGV
ncbi:MAG: exopolysaccharide biosynthesis polyprenyl glycosylphosphotransferase [Labilithrix sp.]